MILLVAKSGAGKDYLCDKLGLKKVISRTTRDKRYSSEDTHLFVSWEQARREYDKAIAKTIFNGNMYYALEEDLIGKEIYLIDKDGVINMDKDLRKSMTVIYVKANCFVRFIHMRKRGDSLKSIFSRLRNDKKAFKGMEKYSDINVSWDKSEDLLKSIL